MEPPADADAKSYFDAKARAWDDKPEHVALATRGVEALLARVPVSSESSSVLEFGCGTGIGSMLLLPRVSRLVGVDASKEMVSVFNHKAEAAGAADKAQALHMFLEDPKQQLKDVMPPDGFDVVFSHLTLHHIEDIEGTVKMLSKCLSENGGVLAISDFEASNHSKAFHPKQAETEVKHHGICPKRLKAALEAAGLANVDVSSSFEFEKSVEGGGTKMFGFLLGLGYMHK